MAHGETGFGQPGLFAVITRRTDQPVHVHYHAEALERLTPSKNATTKHPTTAIRKNMR